MAYSPQTWTNEDPATPLSAARLTHIEDGIQAAAQVADDAADTADNAAPANHTHSFSSLSGSVDDADGGNLQEILEDLAARIAALEP